MDAKIVFLAKKAFLSCQVAYLVGFDLLRAKICVINAFEEQHPVKKRLKCKKSKWPPKREDLKVRNK